MGLGYKAIWVLQDVSGNFKLFNKESSVYEHIPNGSRAKRLEVGPNKWKITIGKKSFDLWLQNIEDSVGITRVR